MLRPLLGKKVQFLSWTCVVVLAACGGSQSERVAQLEQELQDLRSATAVTNPPTTTAEKIVVRATTSSTSSTTDSPTTTTTLPNIATDESKETFKTLAHSRDSIDYSKQIETPCGVFGLVVRVEKIELYQWDGVAWFDRSTFLKRDDYLPDDESLAPKYVWSQDFDGDGFLDLFVEYENNYGTTVGSLFYQRNCVWKWAKFTDQYGGWFNLVNDLSWNKSRGELEGVTKRSDGYTTYFTARYDSGQEMFVLEDIPFSPPPSECVSAVGRISRWNSSDFTESWWGYDEIQYGYWWGGAYANLGSRVPESLEKCRKDDWIAEANRLKSSYNSHYDAQYYDEPYVLLADESAAQVLEQLCTDTVMFFYPGSGHQHEGTLTAFRTDRSIACDSYPYPE